MKNLIFLIKALIFINFTTAIGFFLYRNFENPSVVKANTPPVSMTYHRAVKLASLDHQEQIQEKNDKIAKKEQEIEILKNKLREDQKKSVSTAETVYYPLQASTSPISREGMSPPPENNQKDISQENKVNQAIKPTYRQNLPHLPPEAPSLPTDSSTPVVIPSQASEIKDENPSDSLENSLNQANNLAIGLLVAQNKGYVAYGSQDYKRYQTAIALLRKGESLEESGRKAKISLEKINQVVTWGENRPGNPENHEPPLLKQANWEDKEDSIHYANDIAAGLLIANRKGQINYGTSQYKRVQTAIKLLRQNETLSQAAARSNVPLDTLKQLIAWGQTRPGNEWPAPISRRLENDSNQP